MRKVWIYKRTKIKGWWVGWYESGKRKTKALPSNLAEHFRQIKYVQLNSDVFTGTVTVDWVQMREEYTQYKKVKGDKQATLYETALTLSHVERLIGRCSSRQITQNTIDKFILDRGKEIKRTTLNKDIRNLRAFIHWCRKNRYLNGEIELSLLKEDELRRHHRRHKLSFRQQPQMASPKLLPILESSAGFWISLLPSSSCPNNRSLYFYVLSV